MNEKLIDFLKQSIQFVKNLVWNNKDKKEINEVLQSDLLDKTKPLRMAKAEELTDEILNQAIQNNNKIWIGNANAELNKALRLQDAKIIMSGNAMKHILKRHGIQSNLVQKSKQEALNLEDIKNHANFINNADKQGIGIGNDNQKVLISGKQINGYYIIVETISQKNNELNLKTMYKEKGKLENSKAFDEVKRLLNFKEKSSNPLLQRTSINLDSSHLFTKGFQRSEVAGACDILESGGEVSKPSHLQIKYTANQDFGKNPECIVAQNTNSFYSKFKNSLKNMSENLTKNKEKLENTQELKEKDSNIESHHKLQRRQK